jgi:hypothetical protein
MSPAARSPPSPPLSLPIVSGRQSLVDAIGFHSPRLIHMPGKPLSKFGCGGQGLASLDQDCLRKSAFNAAEMGSRSRG